MGEEDHPLEDWLFISARVPPGNLDQHFLRLVRTSLDQLEKALAGEAGSKQRFSDLLPPFYELTPLTLPPSERERAQQLAVQLAKRGTRDAARAEAFLLNAIGFTQATESLPFWQALLDLKRSRDSFAPRRRQFAVGALALLAIRQASPAAYAALDAALQHTNEQVRAQAAYYLGSAYAIPRRPLPEHVLVALNACASNDPAFEVRYQARMTLRYVGVPAPLDRPGGVYLFRVQLRDDRSGATRTIALRPEQTLEDLHFAIQDAFAWDADHLYSFFLRGKEFDAVYEISGPDGDPFAGALFGEDLQLITGEEAAGVEDDEDVEPLDATTAVLGQLGLRVGHTLLYYFDYGDDHKFDVTLVTIQPQAEPGDYPRLVESTGDAPPQYYGDEDEDDEEDDDWEEEI
ncbi:plasmid pRiA4b ORF-3 family protein [Candidatus Chloroploca sp. M-50]|uniref:Plasmid pRiA4b ORF-3 family protein n=1 Tax=Candidatus Chloroploca mongolica TaxID=2528176 RepID=A0ABS4DFV9_9CHLR|nr:plasmid pRiA4b ORF-3 family protein [Candidatus Chloroploca mongolica]MBP1468326.1 plasmid pRiA4b ORF-3 family protein [Candidatus Chloroploca mongolica]